MHFHVVSTATTNIFISIHSTNQSPYYSDVNRVVCFKNNIFNIFLFSNICCFSFAFFHHYFFVFNFLSPFPILIFLRFNNKKIINILSIKSIKNQNKRIFQGITNVKTKLSRFAMHDGRRLIQGGIQILWRWY